MTFRSVGNTVKYLFCLLFSATALFASRIGDTYQQVIAENGNPKSQIDAGSLRVLNYPGTTIKLRDNVVVSIKAVVAEPQGPTDMSPAPAKPPSPQAQIDTLKRQLNDAVTRVKGIINQEVASQPKPPALSLWIFHFHDGATRPDFNTVDVRTSQETNNYDAHEYITWEGRPELMWPGNELEFNPMTKFFYVDRTVPKKRLSESEMVEVNRLYRIIGRCEQQLSQLGSPEPVP
jgi:hypothetical protein